MRERPDILLLDISMPLLNGVEVARVLETALPETRIVVLTGYSDSEEYARALLRLGVKDYLSKTASLEEFIAARRSPLRACQAHPHGAGGLRPAGLSGATGAGGEAGAAGTGRVAPGGEGDGNAAIAKELFIVERTVEFHVTNLLGKLQASSRTEAVYLARQKKWLP